MKKQLTTIILLCLGFAANAQNKIDANCFNRIAQAQKGNTIPRYTEIPILIEDTFHFGTNQIIYISPNSDSVGETLLKQGILYPKLIRSASTRHSGTLKKSVNLYKVTLEIGHFSHVILPNSDFKIRAFSFWVNSRSLIQLNPSEYLIILRNENAEPTTSNSAFLEDAEIIGFGFCTRDI